ncbi:hypothetical protein DN585_14165 [Intrasporangium calvum]|nr:hypothetical protein DN585_14165 [Intrasporangium calvum]
MCRAEHRDRQANPEGGSPHPLDPVALRPGDNTITMARQDYRWLEAAGPCRGRLILDGPGPVVHRGGGDVNADGVGSPSGPFQDENNVSTAVVFTNEGADGSGKFTIRLGAACDSEPCPPPLATVHVFTQGTVTYPGQVVTSSPTP